MNARSAKPTEIEPSGCKFTHPSVCSEPADTALITTGMSPLAGLRSRSAAANSGAKRRDEAVPCIARLDGPSSANTRQPSTDLCAVVVIFGTEPSPEIGLLVEHDK